MKALRFDGSLRLWHDREVPRLPGETLVQVICAGICNTDLEIVKGYANFQGTPGHEFVGRVVESEADRLVGQRVVGEINVGCGGCGLCLRGDSRHCAERTVLGIKGRDGAFAEYLSLPSRNLIPIPDNVPTEVAVFAEPLAAAYQIMDQVEVGPDSGVAVIGDGKLAQLIARVMAQTGCRLTIFGKHADKLRLAEVTGATPVLIRNGELPQGDGGGRDRQTACFDVVIEASGSAQGLPLAVKLVRPRGAIVLKSTHHASTTVDMAPIVVNEISLIGSRCGRLQAALELLSAGSVDPTPLISHRFSLEDGLQAFEAAGAAGALKVILSMSEPG